MPGHQFLRLVRIHYYKKKLSFLYLAKEISLSRSWLYTSVTIAMVIYHTSCPVDPQYDRFHSYLHLGVTVLWTGNSSTPIFLEIGSCVPQGFLPNHSDFLPS